jgi:hypothetical protein
MLPGSWVREGGHTLNKPSARFHNSRLYQKIKFPVNTSIIIVTNCPAVPNVEIYHTKLFTSDPDPNQQKFSAFGYTVYSELIKLKSNVMFYLPSLSKRGSRNFFSDIAIL